MYLVSYVHSTNLSRYSKKYIQPPSPLNLEIYRNYKKKESLFSGTCKKGIVSGIVNRIVSQSTKTSVFRIVWESYPELYTKS